MSRHKCEDLRTAKQWDKAGYKLRKNAKGILKKANCFCRDYTTYYSESDVLPKTANELAKEKRKRVKEREKKKVERLLLNQQVSLKSEFKKKSDIAQLNLAKAVLAKTGKALYTVYIQNQYYDCCTYIGDIGLKVGDKVMVPYGSYDAELWGVIKGPSRKLYEDFPLGLKTIIRKEMLPVII